MLIIGQPIRYSVLSPINLPQSLSVQTLACISTLYPLHAGYGLGHPYKWPKIPYFMEGQTRVRKKNCKRCPKFFTNNKRDKERQRERQKLMQKMGTMEERETERKRDGDTHTYIHTSAFGQYFHLHWHLTKNQSPCLPSTAPNLRARGWRGLCV